MTSSKAKRYRLGLDLGTNSIGWTALLLDDQGEPCKLLDMGVRIFPDGRDAQSKTSNAAERRVARGQRRGRDRYLKRRDLLMRTLVEFGLMARDKDDRKAVQRLDPYTLRARALDQSLEPFEVGRVLFHLNQRRGFKSNRRADNGDEPEGRTLRQAISELRRSMEESGARTLGEFLAWRHERRDTVRARPELGLYPDRAMYESEFQAIRKVQEPCLKLSHDQWNRLRDIIFSQLPLAPVEPGWCQFEFENEERRAAKALPVFQEFRILQEINNLRLQIGSEPERSLNKEERSKFLKRLRSGKDIDFRKPTRDLRLPPRTTFNLARGERSKLKGDETTAQLSSAGKPARGKNTADPGLFGTRWHDLSLDERNKNCKVPTGRRRPGECPQQSRSGMGPDRSSGRSSRKCFFD